MNFVLSLIKIIFGLSAHAHAVFLDGINSLSDMTSSILSIISAKLSDKRSSKKHPMGFGRLEYAFSLIITMIILYIGIKSVVESIKSILNPHDPPLYELPVIIIMCVSLVAKMVYGLLMRRKGKEVVSLAMRIAGTESMGDGLVALSILAAIAVYKITGADIEDYLCIAISLLIIYTGIRVIVECMLKIVGGRADPGYKHKVYNLLISEDGVLNVSNLMLHSYGENVLVGSVDIEVDENMSASQISRLSRRLIRRAQDIDLILTSVGISAANVKDPKAYEIWDKIIDTARRYKTIVGVNSFVVDFEENVLSFYVVLDRGMKSELAAFSKELQGYFPDMRIEILDVIDR